MWQRLENVLTISTLAVCLAVLAYTPWPTAQQIFEPYAIRDHAPAR